MCIVHKLNHIKLIPGTCTYVSDYSNWLAPAPHNAQHSTSYDTDVRTYIHMHVAPQVYGVSSIAIYVCIMIFF